MSPKVYIYIFWDYFFEHELLGFLNHYSNMEAKKTLNSKIVNSFELVSLKPLHGTRVVYLPCFHHVVNSPLWIFMHQRLDFWIIGRFMRSLTRTNITSGLTSSRPSLLFHFTMNCHEGHMLILHHGDETYAKLVWVARASSQPKFVSFNPHCHHI